MADQWVLKQGIFRDGLGCVPVLPYPGCRGLFSLVPVTLKVSVARHSHNKH